MALALPRTLSPSKVAAYTDCPLAFRFTAIERLPEPSSEAQVKGTLVHAALEGLFWNYAQGERSEARALDELAQAADRLSEDPEYQSLEMSETARLAFLDDAERLVRNYFLLEDPNAVNAVGMEITLQAEINGVVVRGIIDRLDIDENGDFIVIDYKTGRAPSQKFEQNKMNGVNLYALLCEMVLGKAPVRVELLHLRDPVAISATTTEQKIRAQRQKTGAVWQAIERACASNDFRPRPSSLCQYCHFRAFCPAFGGDPEQAAVVLTQPPAPLATAV